MCFAPLRLLRGFVVSLQQKESQSHHSKLDCFFLGSWSSLNKVFQFLNKINEQLLKKRTFSPASSGHHAKLPTYEETGPNHSGLGWEATHSSLRKWFVDSKKEEKNGLTLLMKMLYKGAIKFQIQQPTVAMVQLIMVKRSSCMYAVSYTHLTLPTKLEV